MFDHLLATEADTTGSGSYNQVEHYVLDVSPEIPVAGQPGTAQADTFLILGQNGAVVDRLFYGLGAAGADVLIDEEGIPTPGQAGTDHWMLADNLNTTRDIIDDTSAVVDRIDFNAFGQIGYESNPSVAHFAGFEGGHVDPNTGLVSNYHRWYDPATGRWMSADPSDFGARDANLSRYVLNDPERAADPSGLKPKAQGYWLDTVVGYKPVTTQGSWTETKVGYKTEWQTVTFDGSVFSFPTKVQVTQTSNRSRLGEK